MSTWKKIVAVDAESSSADNSFVTINADESVEVIRINDLSTIPVLGDYTSVSEVLIDNGDSFVFPVDNVSGSAHYKVSVGDIAGMLTIGMIYDLVDSGSGDISTYTGTSGVVGDFNGDGSVSTADLLQFLTMFGGDPNAVFSSGYLNIANCPTLTSIPTVTGIDEEITSDSQLNLLEISNSTGNAGSFESTINSTSGNEYIEWGETTGINWNTEAFASKRLKVVGLQNAFKYVPTVQGAGVRFWLKVQTFTSGGVALETAYVSLGSSTSDVGTAGTAVYVDCNAVNIGGANDNILSLNQTSGGVAVGSVRLQFFVQNLFGSITSVEIENINTIMYPTS